jgi:hypothetical protein
MRKLAAVITLALVAVRAPSLVGADTPLQRAALAWDAGDYVSALSTYLQILDAPDADPSLETIALETGELFHTTELTADGLGPRFSPDGRHVLYETGPQVGRLTRLLPGDGSATPVAELQGASAAFSPDSARIAYLALTPTPALHAAQAALRDKVPQAERTRRQNALNMATAAESRLVIREIAGGRETVLDTGDLKKTGLAFGASGVVLLSAATDENVSQIYSVAQGRPAVALTTGIGEKTLIDANAPGTAALYTRRVRTGDGGRGGGGGGATTITFGVVLLPEGRAIAIEGNSPSFSADGGSLTYVQRGPDEYRVMVAPAHEPAKAAVVRSAAERLDEPALSPDGSRLVFQMMQREDWELFAIDRDGTGEARITREIQHDVLPRFITPDRLLATIGEARHRRSYLYDLPSMTRRRLFHNNTVRTIAPEYAWAPSSDGTRLLIGAERDGDTVSPERGIYMVDLRRRVTREELRARVQANLDAERALGAKGRRLYAPIAAAVRSVVAEASVARVFGYEKALFDFDSKHVSRPGNKLASAYLFETYKSFGYEPEFQWFAPRGALGGQSANVIATLEGTVNPELVYVVSSHYDSVAAGPGADDDSSGTAALLETARVLAGRPQPATIVFASFTGEESGLLGSREFVRRALDRKTKIVGALNNDMVGWANDHRLDNTIRYSNAGIRDIQHAAAMQFTNLITYDARYYKSTDAAAYYEAYGDIVGGIGSYPILGNPHYHQPHDLLDTINHQLVTEVAKTTAATLMLLASSPSRLTGLKVDGFANGTAKLSWTPGPEAGVTGYIVAYGTAAKPEAQQLRVARAAATLTGVTPGTVVRVKAVNAKGLEGWDWASVVIPRG